MVALVAQQSNISLPIDEVLHGDCLEALRTLPSNSVDAIVSDPPAGISFMGKDWDNPNTFPLEARSGKRSDGGPSFGGGLRFNEMGKKERDAFIAFMTSVMSEALRVLKPGGYGLIWALPRTSHWTALALEDAGFIVKDCVSHIFGSGFPKSMDISKAIDRAIYTTRTANPDFARVRAWLRAKVKAKGLTYREIDHALGNENSHKASHYLDNSQPQLPTPHDWEIIKGLLNLSEDNDLDRPPRLLVETFEREIIGYRKVQKGVAFSSEGKTEVPITIPLSDEAQQWAGYGTALKPSTEFWWLVQKPISEKTIAANVLRWNCGALNIDACRVDTQGEHWSGNADNAHEDYSGKIYGTFGKQYAKPTHPQGRFPSHLLLSHSLFCTEDSCDRSCPVRILDEQSGIRSSHHNGQIRIRDFKGWEKSGDLRTERVPVDQGGASRYFQTFHYFSKSSRRERNQGCEGLPEQRVARVSGIGNDTVRRCPEHDAPIPSGSTHYTCGCPQVFEEKPFERIKPVQNTHPTVKSLSLMSWLCRLITPPDGIVLDPFLGSGSTAVAALREGFHFIGIEAEAEYVAICEARIAHALKEVN